MGKVIASGYAKKQLNPVFSQNTWDDIILACQRNNIPDTWNIGDQKDVIIGGQTYFIDIIGKNIDVYAENDNKAPLTFGLHEVIGMFYQMNTSASYIDYPSSTMNNITLQIIFGLLPDIFQENIQNIKKDSNSFTAKLFVFSQSELTGDYPYFNSDTRRKKVVPTTFVSATTTKDLAAAYWTRTGRSSSTTHRYYFVSNAGTIGSTGAYPTDSYRVSFGFCF